MPTLPLYQVDAFTDRPFAGNPAAVCPLEAPIPEALMQDIAAENNLSETAFFHPQGDAFSLRWFTPTAEVDLCGHATLASAFVLMTELEPARTEVTFRSRSGLLHVRRRDAEFVLDFPAYPAAPADAETAARVADALGARPREVVRARALFAVFDDAKAVRAVAPDFRALAALPTTVGVTAPGGDESRPVDFVSRYFAPVVRHRRGSRDRLRVLHARALLGGAARQAGDARAPGQPPRRRDLLRARRRPRAHRRQGAPGDHWYAHLLRAAMDDLFCSFCGKRRHEVRKLISGPRVFICNECVVLCREIIGPRPPSLGADISVLERTTEDLPAQPLADDEDVTVEKKPPDERHCSFCRKLKTDVAKLVSGPTVYICNECVELCEDVIAADPDLDPPAA